MREIRRLEEILTEQLEFARSRPRPGSGRHLVEVVRETLLLVREEAEKKGVRVVEEASGPGPPSPAGPGQGQAGAPQHPEERPRGGRGADRILVARARAGGRSAGGDRQRRRADRRGRSSSSLFVPFATTKAGGPGSAWRWPHQIVKEHGERSRSAPESRGACRSRQLPDPGEPGPAPGAPTAQRRDRAGRLSGREDGQMPNLLIVEDDASLRKLYEAESPRRGTR